MKLQNIKGIGPKTEKLYNKLGIYLAEDLLYYFPEDYFFYDSPGGFESLKEGEISFLKARIAGRPAIFGRGRILSVKVLDERGISGTLYWFNSGFLASSLRAGEIYVFYGRASSYKGHLTINQSSFCTTKRYNDLQGSIIPVYGKTKGLSNKSIVKTVRELQSSLPMTLDYIPEKFIYNRNLITLDKALMDIHFPDNEKSLELARRRLIYDEFFLFLLGLSIKSKKISEIKSSHVFNDDLSIDKYIGKLPFKLTASQEKTIKTIRSELSSGYVMNRLIEGDVGSGKTVIAFIAVLMAAFSGEQSAFLAPTSILAKQHYVKISDAISRSGLPFKVVFLDSSLKAIEKRSVYKEIESGEADIIVGTHAIFEEKLKYKNLGLAICDEQHRFGVRQRESLREKGDMPHILALSATPIPRTLAMLLYADMNLSIIDEKPGGRKSILNALVNQNYRATAYRFILDEIKKGRQAYIICPMVEPDEMLSLNSVKEYSEKIRGIFPSDVSISTLHGKMKTDEKNRIMTEFLNGDIDILVSTTVVEVGVDVGNATVMMIENAERFGLAQLHQLRGRVGRSDNQSYCILVDCKNTEKSRERLSILENSNDGFLIAKEDLRLRGPGEFFGLRQSGDIRFRLGDIIGDGDIFKAAGEDVFYLLKEDPRLENTENIGLKKELMKYIEKAES